MEKAERNTSGYKLYIKLQMVGFRNVPGDHEIKVLLP